MLVNAREVWWREGSERAAEGSKRAWEICKGWQTTK